MHLKEGMIGGIGAGRSSVNPDRTTEFCIPVNERVFVTEFSPFQASQNLLALGLSSSVMIISLKFPEDEETILQTQYQIITEIHHDSRVQSLAFNPTTSLCVAPKVLKFATGDTEHNLRLFFTDLGAKEEVRTCKGHRDYINSIVFQPETGEQVVSGSDDHSIILWDSESGQKIHTIPFRSPVMTVIWHPQEVSKLMIAEKIGVIHIFNIISYHPIMSVDCGSGPLSSADWSLSNSSLVAVALRSDWLNYDLSKPSLPIARRSLHQDGMRIVKFASCTDSLVASTGQPNYSVKVVHTNNSHLSLSLGDRPVGGLSWHYRHNYLVVGHNGKVSIHKIPYTI